MRVRVTGRRAAGARGVQVANTTPLDYDKAMLRFPMCCNADFVTRCARCALLPEFAA
jgi:hypothetical protein